MPNTHVPAAAEGLPEIQSPPLSTLTFIEKRRTGGGFNYWADVPAGKDYAEDGAIGRLLGEEFVRFMGKYPSLGNSTVLPSIVLDMQANGAPRGQIIGFMTEINKYAMAGAYLHALDEAEKKQGGRSDV